MPARFSRRPRTILLVVDALVGAALLTVALWGMLPRPSDGEAPAANTQATAPELTARYGGLAPPGQTTGLAVAADGSLGIVDRGRNIVLHLDANGRPIDEWGPRFGGGLDAQDLLGLAADADGWYVLDRGAQRIVHLDRAGKIEPSRTIDLQALQTYGPTGLGVDRQGRLHMADTGRDRILVFDASGRQVAVIGDSGAELGKLKQPMGLAFGPDGALFVADWENGRIERWDAGGEATNAWPLPVHAWGLAVDRLGRVFVPDGDRKLVRAFGQDGQLLFELGRDSPGPLPVESPSQVAVSADGASLWVLGSDALARVDLRPYSGVRSAEASGGVRWPLAVAGVLLLVVAAVGAKLPRPRRGEGGGEGQRTPRELADLPDADAPLTRLRRPRPSRGEAVPLPRGPALFGGSVLIVLGGLGTAIAGVRLTEPLALSDPWPRMALLAVSSLVFALGCVLAAQVVPLAWLSEWPGQPAPGIRLSRRWLLFAGGGVSALFALLALVIWWQQRFQTPDATRGAVFWLVGIVIAAALCARWCVWRVPRLSIWTVLPWVLYGLALAPRIWNGADLPYGIWFDEAQAGLEARRLLAEGRYTPITDTFGRDASLFYYLIAVAQQMIKDPVAAGRGVAALVGAANAPLLYLLGREVFGWRVGLAAGVLIATSRWHLDVSRLGWDPISLPVCVTLGFWLLARAIRRERWTDVAWAGMAFGLGLHGYIGFRAMPLVAIVLLMYAAWLRRWSVTAATVRFAIFMAGLILVALPVLVFAVQDPAGFNGRLAQTLIFSQAGSQAQHLDELWSNVQKHALMFHVLGDGNGRHNLPGAPMLDPLSGVLAVIGLAWLVVRFLDWRAWLVFGWIAVAMSGGILTLPFEAPQAMRTLAMTPVLALLCAVGLVLLGDRLAEVPKSLLALRSVVPSALAAVALVAIGLVNVTTFFGRQMVDSTVWESFSTRETIPARAALAANGRFESILGSPTIAPSVESALLPPALRDSIRAFDAPSDLPYRGGGPSLIVLETEHDTALADEVARYYPDAPRMPVFAPNAVRPLVDQLVLERTVLTARRGIDASYRGADGTLVQRQETSAELAADQAPVALPAQVAWRAGLALDAPGSYVFQAPEGFTLSLDGALIGRGALDLPRGNHLLELTGTLTTGQMVRLDWQPPGNSDLRTIDPRALYIPPAGGNGLAVTFFPTSTFDGTPQEQWIDPIVSHYFHVNPFSRVNFDPHGNWSAEWRGFLDVPTAGTYRFEAERLSRAGLWIDDRLVFDDTPSDAAEGTSGVVDLATGLHPIRVRLQNRAEGGPRLYLYWTPPGGGRQIVPGRVLYPPRPGP